MKLVHKFNIFSKRIIDDARALHHSLYIILMRLNFNKKIILQIKTSLL